MAADNTTRYQRVLDADVRILWLDIPLSAAPTTVTIDSDNDGSFADETALSLTEFTGDVIYHPLGGLLGQSEPITGIEMTGNGTQYRSWPRNLMVQIIGKHGWPAIPDPIKAAVIQLTGILRLETARATNQITNVDTTIAASPPAQRIINDLMNAYRNVGSLI